MKDFTNYKFRPSSLGKLMVKPRSKSESVSETTKAYLREIFIEEVFGRYKDTSNKFTEKGILVEEDSLDLVTQYYKKLFVKNKERIENDYIIGTPDIILEDKIIDIKSSWDIWTFAAANGNKDYYWQLQGYMWLTGKTQADLVYCLCDAPQHLVYQEKRSQMYRRGLVDEDGTPEFDEMEREVERNMIYNDIDASLRVKAFHYEFAPEKIHEMESMIEQCRKYLNTLSL